MMIPVPTWLRGVGVCAVRGAGSRYRGLGARVRKEGLGLTSGVHDRWLVTFPVGEAFVIRTFCLHHLSTFYKDLFMLLSPNKDP